MNLKFSNLLLVFGAALLLSFSARGQEETPVTEGPDPAHHEINFDEDKTLPYDHPSQNAVVRDSSQQTLKVMPKISRPEAPKESPKERNEEDAMSFNFLYYMIQKFKLSDLIDQ